MTENTLMSLFKDPGDGGEKKAFALIGYLRLGPPLDTVSRDHVTRQLW